MIIEQLVYSLGSDKTNIIMTEIDICDDDSNNKTNEERIVYLENSNLEIIATTFDVDFRVCEIEWLLEDMSNSINILSENNNLGGMKMALSRFEQAKIMIIGDIYNREKLQYQLGKYFEKNYITLGEYDTLIALMDTKELITENKN